MDKKSHNIQIKITGEKSASYRKKISKAIKCLLIPDYKITSVKHTTEAIIELAKEEKAGIEQEILNNPAQIMQDLATALDKILSYKNNNIDSQDNSDLKTCKNNSVRIIKELIVKTSYLTKNKGMLLAIANESSLKLEKRLPKKKRLLQTLIASTQEVADPILKSYAIGAIQIWQSILKLEKRLQQIKCHFKSYFNLLAVIDPILKSYAIGFQKFGKAL